MKKGFTLAELVIVVVILCVLAVIALPMYDKVIKHTGFKEVASIVSLIRAGAKYYDLKYDLTALDADETAWDVLKVDKPSASGTDLTYVITPSDATGNPELEVTYGGNVLYEYDLITGSGTTSADPNAAYLPDDLP